MSRSLSLHPMKLSEAKVDFSGIVKEVLDCEFEQKLYEFGIVPGATVYVIKAAPFKGPLYVKVEDSLLAIRRSEAAFILVN